MTNSIALELDHVFILTQAHAKVADELVSLGLKESFSRDHPGQGTSNRRFEFSNSMLEFLWLRDEHEANNGPASNLRFPQRLHSATASPFGVILSKVNKSDTGDVFSGWEYQPDYFDPPMAFHIGENSTTLTEPLCLYAPFMQPQQRPKAPGTFKYISHVKIHTATDTLSAVLKHIEHADRLSFVAASEHLMELTLDDNKENRSKDFRPLIPLLLHW